MYKKKLERFKKKLNEFKQTSLITPLFTRVVDNVSANKLHQDKKSKVMHVFSWRDDGPIACSTYPKSCTVSNSQDYVTKL